MANVAAAPVRSVLASITFCRTNAEHLEEFVKEIGAAGLFRGIAFNMLTHCPVIVREHGLTGEARNRLLERIWRLKQQGHPIAISRAAWRAFRSGSWKRPVPQVELITDQRVYACCRDVDDPAICDNCGYAGCTEISQILALRPSALWEGLKTMW